MTAMKTTTVAVKSSTNEENENDDIDSGGELRAVIFVFINDEEAVERPAITHLGRANFTIVINMPSVLTTAVHKHVTAKAANTGDNQKNRN